MSNCANDVAAARSQIPINLPGGVFYIGLLGGIGAGKSTVAEEFARLGAAVLAADPLVGQLLETDEIRTILEQKWGSCILDKEGKLDKSQIARLIFASSAAGVEARRFLEELLHPRVAQLLSDEAYRLASEGHRVMVLDVPLLAEVGWHQKCHLLVYVETPPEVCWSRVQGRGWTWSEFLRRQTAQLPPEFKRQLAHVVIDNSGRREGIRDQVASIWRTLIDGATTPR
ncbi:MAG: dephospho-CoA kinase [Thermoguttaceae bacterium]|nr:dephospho-CoA kinase [Thermoguttaceae bacterium]MDW8078091.1 dephospho-CoA kinase [Thermoguttaceae bacterium]